MYELSFEEEILKYLPVVDRVVNRITIKNTDYEKEDLFNIGVIGLMDALKKFDASKKVPFESYAAIRVRGSIFDEVRKHGKISRYRMTQLNEYYEAKRELEQEQKGDVTDTDICQKLAITRAQLNEIYDSLNYLASVSLEATLFNQNDDGMTVEDTIQDQSIPNVEETLLEDERKKALEKSVTQLAEREQIILDLYYKEEMTLKEIAEILGISIARVSQIHGKIISKLKLSIEEELQ
ncbi:sigma-70 family RNA polymerase sigma factor [Enterococcus alcedinis]|uniref:RNA polymerase sigma factor n=1 Tax=Enterococcus alcedinis TaxID=1274384 RepID=A0A917JHY4_9ENTE|nr:FliA/WhiG family RNA polymerase sigma factor [Enterococcus alcedinis]MBP2102606.1 RNA polymerase sigma factor for flagellar operon FliA [Enterococcus alcedinis]GGI66165.1 RNA polymerase sigma factor [Enterococcus alcedinis]